MGFSAYLCLIAVVSLAGAVVPLRVKSLRQTPISVVSFAAGVLLGAVCFSMVPETLPVLGMSVVWLLGGGFLAVAAGRRWFFFDFCPHDLDAREPASHIHVGAVAYVGVSAHSLMDGLAIAASYAHPRLGALVPIAVMVHKFPAALALATLLRFDSWSDRAIIALMTVFALTTPAGALLSQVLLERANERLVAGAVAVSAGVLLAVGLYDVLPAIRRAQVQNQWPIVGLFTGLGIALVGRVLGY